MNTSDFNMPTSHPFGMLSNYDNGNQKESTLVYILSKCIENGSFDFIPTKYEHEDMVKDGLLTTDGTKSYKLTKKSIGLLYAHYGKEK